MLHGVRQGSAYPPSTVGRNRRERAAVFQRARERERVGASGRSHCRSPRPSASDCFYLALAEKEQANFVTADLQPIGKVRGTAWQPRAISLSQYNPSSSR
jgi:hypothetical protein